MMGQAVWGWARRAHSACVLVGGAEVGSDGEEDWDGRGESNTQHACWLVGLRSAGTGGEGWDGRGGTAPIFPCTLGCR